MERLAQGHHAAGERSCTLHTPGGRAGGEGGGGPAGADWCGVGGWEGWGEKGCRPEGSVTDFARCLHHPPSSQLSSFPPGLAPQEGLWTAGACLRCRLPAGALTDESLLPPRGPAREGAGGGLGSGFRGPQPKVWGGSVDRQPPARSQEGWFPMASPPLTDLERTLGPLPG